MTLWNKVLSGFDAEDETVNFGARAVAESYDSIYETTTLATIQADGKVVNNPKIVASIHDSTLCVTIDKSITIFSDTSCQEIKLCIGFDSLITSHCISNDNCFLFVTLTNGTLYCLNLEAGGRIVFFRNVILSHEQSGGVIIKVFFQDAGNGGSDLLLVTSKGHIHKVSGFNSEVMESVFDETDIGKLAKLTQDIRCSLLFKENRLREVSCAEVNLLCEKRSVVMVGEEIYIWPNHQFCGLKYFPYKYTKIQYFRNNRFLLCLRTDGALNIVCCATLIAKKVWDGPVSDMIIVEDEPDASPEILVLLKPKEGSATTFIQLVSFPDFGVKFNLEVPTTTYLVNLNGGSIDEIIFLEGVGTISAAIDTVKVKAIEENLPECRLQRLLRRGKYEEAEIFAERFNLGTDIIYCAKAVALTQEFNNSSSNDIDISNKLNQLINTLDKINNVELVFQHCHNTVTPDIEQTRRLVCYARERLIKDAEKTNDHSIAMHLLNLNNTLLRIETYEMISKIKDNLHNDTFKDREDIHNWIEFSKADLLNVCKNYLIHGELRVAALIWVRHSSTLLSHVTKVMVREMLQIIPSDIMQRDLWPWLFHFVPSLLSVFPDGLSEIVIWGYERAKSFEKYDETNSWPESGLDFCKSLMKLLNFEESQSFLHLQQQYTTIHSPLQHLTAVIQALTDLQYLKTHYRLKIEIQAYMGEPIEVAHLLLQKIYSQKVSDFIKDFLHRYMLNHSLKNDHVLILYIQKTLKKSEGWWFWTEAPWEEKIASIIGCIHNVKCRLQQTLDTVKKASVPWSPVIEALVETSVSLNHSLVSSIITERNSVATKLILKKYRFQHIGITDTLIKYIIKQNRKEMLDDLYKLTKSNRSLRTQALSICVNFFLNKGDLEQTIAVIKNQSNEDAIYCCKQIISYISICLRFKEMNNTADYYTELIGIVQAKLRSILSSESANTRISSCDDVLATASELKSICLLRSEFGINLTLMEYQTENETVLQENLKNLCEELENRILSTSTIYKRAGRMAELLKLPKILAVCFLIENTGNTEILKHYIEGLNGLSYFTAEECSYVKRLCEICVFNLKKGSEPKALSALKNVSASALDNCSIGELSQMLLTTVWTHLNCKIIDNEEMINGTYMRNGIGDTIKWRLHNIYTDPAMCSGQMILPFFIKSFKFHSRCTDMAKFRGDTPSAEENCSEQLIDLIGGVRAIPTESYDFPVLQILNTLASSCSSISMSSEKLIPAIQSVREKCLRILLQKIISARIFDLQSGLSCLFMLSEQDAFKWLISACKMYQTDYSRLRAVSDLGYEYCYAIKNSNHLNYFGYYRVCHYWVRKLSDYGVHHKEIIMSNTEGKQEILERLMRSEKSAGLIDLLKDFCTDFEFDFDECYILYLDILLKQWKPTIKIVTLNSEKELKINKDEISALHKTCKQVASLIEDKSAMRKHLATLWSKINFYHYEVFLLIMELLEDNNETRLNHFYFLQNYVRFGQPTQIEYEEWSQLCPENNSLPVISKWRLPFLLKVDQWKLIEPELNLSTYEKWMEVSPILNLQIHLICTFAIKGSVNKIWGSSNELKKRNPSEWLIHSKNSALLEDIKTCIKHMPDQDALYYGTAVLYYVVNHTPPGADQAAAAQECYAYAQKWAQASVQSDAVMIEKTRFKYLQLTAKHILHTHGLGNDHYLQLAVFPERLVRELYMDESIVLRSRGATEHRPDINSAVKLLGDIFSLNLIQLRLELLDEWLQPNDCLNSKLDDSITYNIAAVSSGNEENAVDDDNLLRACYILEWGDKVLSANYLINIGFGAKNESSFRPGIQFRALQVLLSITDSATVQDLTKRDLQSIKQYMKSLQYVSELERLGLTFNVHRFENCSKLELAQALSRNHARLPQTLILILQMCIDFELKSYTLWDETLSAMAKMSMVKELGKFLPKVLTASHAVGCNGYIKGWEVLIWEPFRKTDALFSQKQFDECLTSICLLHSCPVARKLSLKPIITICFQSNRPELAAALLPFLNKIDTDFVLEAISSSCKIQKVIEDLRALSTRQILTISYSVRILEELLQSNLVKDE